MKSREELEAELKAAEAELYELRKAEAERAEKWRVFWLIFWVSVVGSVVEWIRRSIFG